jgi:hypothetical protein
LIQQTLSRAPLDLHQLPAAVAAVHVGGHADRLHGDVENTPTAPTIG